LQQIIALFIHLWDSFNTVSFTLVTVSTHPGHGLVKISLWLEALRDHQSDSVASCPV